MFITVGRHPVLHKASKVEGSIVTSFLVIHRENVCNVREMIDIALHRIGLLLVLLFLLSLELIDIHDAFDCFLIV